MTGTQKPFTKPFAASAEKRSMDKAKLQAEVDELKAFQKQWPSLRSLFTVYAIPKMKSWIEEIKAVIQPNQLGDLAKNKRRVEFLKGITWWHPRGLLLRLRILGYGLAILIFSLLALGLLIGLAILAFTVITFLIEYLSRFLTFFN